VFDQSQDQMNVGQTAYAMVKLEASIQYLMEFKGSNVGMSKTDFELYTLPSTC
jgi:hypothetical protein